jgi:hypothetical protein
MITEDMEKKFQNIFPLITMNESFQLKVNSDENIFKFGSDIPVLFNNKSPYKIFFATDSFIKLFIIRDNKWLEIRNRNKYSGVLVLSSKGTSLSDFNTTGVRPVLDNNIVSEGKEELLRIVMIGELMENGIRTGNFVGAYVDVYVSP